MYAGDRQIIDLLIQFYMIKVYIISCIFLLSFVFYTSAFLPFILAFLLANLLNKIVKKIHEKTKIPNKIISIIIFIIAILVLFIATVVFMPLLYNQILFLGKKLPIYVAKIQFLAVPYINKILGLIDEFNYGMSSGSKITEYSKNIISEFSTHSKILFKDIFSFTISVINLFVFLVLTPILLFYFLKDFDTITYKITKNVNKYMGKRYINLFTEIKNLIGIYLKSQLLVCTILFLYYYACLSLLKLDFALIVSIISGLSIIIPLLGISFSLFLSTVIYFSKFGWDDKIIFVFLSYLIGHILESLIITPNIIGDKMKLHPLLILFGVIFFGMVFGFWGMVFAIPIIGTTKIILKFLLEDHSTQIENNKL
jgi:putative permease